MNVTGYARQLQQLLPPGALWNLEPGSVLSQTILGLAEEFARVDQRARDLIDEFDPRTTYELLGDWERVYGLPDTRLAAVPSIAQRRAMLVAKVISTGGQTPAYFVAIAAALGFTVTITEFRAHTVNDQCDTTIRGGAWAYAWQVNAPLNSVGTLDVGNASVADPLAWWGNQVLELVLGDLKPAHTHLLFAYS